MHLEFVIKYFISSLKKLIYEKHIQQYPKKPCQLDSAKVTLYYLKEVTT